MAILISFTTTSSNLQMPFQALVGHLLFIPLQPGTVALTLSPHSLCSWAPALPPQNSMLQASIGSLNTALTQSLIHSLHELAAFPSPQTTKQQTPS